MKFTLVVLMFLVAQNIVYAQNDLLRYVPLPPVKRYAPPVERVRTEPIINNYYKSDDSKPKPIDFDNSTLNFFKVHHYIENNNTRIIDEITNENRRFFIRTNYIIDEKKNFVWDIKEKEINSNHDEMIFTCSRENKYYIIIGVKMDGTRITFYSPTEAKYDEYYIIY